MRIAQKKRRRQVKLPCDPAQVKTLAINCSTMAEAEQSVPKLARLIARHETIAAAWQRGRFLRNLGGLASVPVTVDEAARLLELRDPDELHRMIENDPEVRDTWRQKRQEAFIRIKLALVKTAREGNQAAIRAVESFLRTEMELKRLPDARKLKISDIAALTGRARPTIYDWINIGHLPIADDKTIDLGAFIRWFETYIGEAMVPKVGKKTDQSSRLHQIKAEQIEMQLKRQRHELLPRDEVMAGIIARHQLLINSIRQKAPQIAQLCQAQKPERVIKIIVDSLADICRELCEIPAQLHLSDRAAKAYQDVLKMVNDEIESRD